MCFNLYILIVLRLSELFIKFRGKEFNSAEAKRLYQEKKIVYKYKYGLNKG